MIVLKSIELKTGSNNNVYPLTLPVISNFEPLEFESPVTIFVGEKGSGKSTLIEALAIGLNAIAIGSESLNTDESLSYFNGLSRCPDFLIRRFQDG